MGLEATLLSSHCSQSRWHRLDHLEDESTDHFEGISASHTKGQIRAEMARTHHRSHTHLMENVTLTPKEQMRVEVLSRLLAEQIALDQAVELMGVSTRHARRITTAYREEGAAALAHGHRGRRPVNATPKVSFFKGYRPVNPLEK